MASFDTDKQRRLDETIDKLRARYGCKRWKSRMARSLLYSE